MNFHATDVEYWTKGQVETVFFGNQEQGLALLLSTMPGTADYYLEWNDQANACVNGIKAAVLSGEELHVQLLKRAAEQLGEADFRVSLACDDEVFREVSQRLRRILRTKLRAKQASGNSRGVASAQRDYSRVKYLNLEGKDLARLPDYVAGMTELETVKLGSNPRLDLQAAFEVLARLPNVRHLTFSTEATVPDTLGQLSQLETLSVTGLTKPCAFPETIGQLKRLQSLLVMSDADVVFPETFAELANLEQWNVRAPSWQLPSRFYQLAKLTLLDFSYCRMLQVPEEMAQMHQLETVIFCSPDERDYPQILSVVARMPSVRVLEVTADTVPQEIGLCRNLEALTVWGSGDPASPFRLPNALFGLTQLNSLSLNMGHFDAVPEGIGRLTGLRQLCFREASFETLPETLGDLASLELLNISENPSLRSLPESLGRLDHLTDLYLEDNPLLAELPASAKNLTAVTSVRISNHETVRNVPESWVSLLTDA